MRYKCYKGEKATYTRSAVTDASRAHIIFLEDELVANLIGDIFASNSDEENAKEVLKAKLSTGEYTVSFPPIGERDARERTFNVKEELLPIIQKVFQVYRGGPQILN